jgi:hypothetical protein
MAVLFELLAGGRAAEPAEALPEPEPAEAPA